jgi:Multimeric flavodoxin WrbA
MSFIFLLMPGEASDRLKLMVQSATECYDVLLVKNAAELPDLRNKRILFAAELDNSGVNIGILQIFSVLFQQGKDSLSGSTGIVIVRSQGELNTKSAAQNIIFNANQLGCRFPGHPLVEATGNLNNFRAWQKQINKPLEDICMDMCKKLGLKLVEDNPNKIHEPNILVLHSSQRKTSNTLKLWNMVSNHLSSCTISELHVENGDVLDCKGCSYKTCIHYSKQNSCFYGGVMVKDILPAIEKSDAIIWICPNYNDAVSANLTAVINRLTALYRKINFYDKTMYAVIVSGNSGGDSVARQLIGALNINKGFRLPPGFSIMATANDPGEIEKVADIEDKAYRFANNIINEIKA